MNRINKKTVGLIIIVLLIESEETGVGHSIKRSMKGNVLHFYTPPDMS